MFGLLRVVCLILATLSSLSLGIRLGEKQTSTWELWYPGKKKLEERYERVLKLSYDLRDKSRKLQELNTPHLDF